MDGDFLLRVLIKHKAVFVNDIVYKMRKHDKNISANREKRMLASIEIIERLTNSKPEMKSIIGQDCINQRLSYRHYKLAKTLRKKREYQRALENINKAISLRPFAFSYRLYKLLISKEYWRR